MRSSTFLPIAFAGHALAQGAAYSQCGGDGWTGATTCVSGYTCQYGNAYYSQCVPDSDVTTAATTTTTAAAATTTSAASSTTLTTLVSSSTTTTAPATSTDTSSGSFVWFGVDESGAEFGTAIPGVWGVDFIFPAESTIDTLVGQGFNIFRLPFLMERMVPTNLTGAPDAAYIANYTAIVDYITGLGAWAVIDPHNYGRYYGDIIESTSDFGAFWTTIATAFASNDLAIFDTNNEFHDEEQDLVLDLNQAAIDAIRAAGATTQYIFIEGNDYTAAYTWNTTNTDLAGLTDSVDGLLVYEMHQYLDSDNSGTSDVCVSDDIGVQRIEGATAWLRENGKVGVLGEFAGGANTVCYDAVEGMLDSMQENSDVWLGALWWGGGPWWGDYIYSFEPPDGTAYTYYDSLLVTYTP